MEDFRFYSLTFFGLSVSMMELLNPYLEFGVLMLSIISVLIKIYKDSKK